MNKAKSTAWITGTFVVLMSASQSIRSPEQLDQLLYGVWDTTCIIFTGQILHYSFQAGLLLNNTAAASFLSASSDTDRYTNHALWCCS